MFCECDVMTMNMCQRCQYKMNLETKEFVFCRKKQGFVYPHIFCKDFKEIKEKNEEVAVSK